MTTKQSEEYFSHRRCKKNVNNTEMASRFWLAALHRTIIWFSLIIYIYILARQVIHFSS